MGIDPELFGGTRLEEVGLCPLENNIVDLFLSCQDSSVWCWRESQIQARLRRDSSTLASCEFSSASSKLNSESRLMDLGMVSYSPSGPAQKSQAQSYWNRRASFRMQDRVHQHWNFSSFCCVRWRSSISCRCFARSGWPPCKIQKSLINDEGDLTYDTSHRLVP